jgi:hypothetical protein
MRRLLYSLGYTDEDLAKLSHSINPGDQAFMKEILRYCREEPTLKALGCICIGAECNGSEYFRKIHDSFRKKPCMQDAELYILEIHAGDDIEHRSKMLRLIEPYLQNPTSSELLEQGYLDSYHLFQELWTSMLFYEDSIQYSTMAVAPVKLEAHP